jgi:hypothetical protein
LSRLRLRYDRDSDTLLGTFDDRAVRSSVEWIGGDVSALVHLDTDEVVGFYVEHVLQRVVPQHPPFVDYLDGAELTGITPAELRRLRQDLGLPSHRQSLGSLVADLNLLTGYL